MLPAIAASRRVLPGATRVATGTKQVAPRRVVAEGDRTSRGSGERNVYPADREKLRGKGATDVSGTKTIAFSGLALLGGALYLAAILAVNYYLQKYATYNAIKKAARGGIIGNDQNRQNAENA